MTCLRICRQVFWDCRRWTSTAFICKCASAFHNKVYQRNIFNHITQSGVFDVSKKFLSNDGGNSTVHGAEHVSCPNESTAAEFLDNDELMLYNFYKSNEYKELRESIKNFFKEDGRKLDKLLELQQQCHNRVSAYPDRLFWDAVFGTIYSDVEPENWQEPVFRKRIELLKNLLEIFKDKNDAEMLSICSQIVRIIAKYYSMRNSSCSADDQELIYSCYNRMLSVSRTLPSFVLRDLIHGFSLTDQRRKVFEFLPEFLLTNSCNKVNNIICKVLLAERNEEYFRQMIDYISRGQVDRNLESLRQAYIVRTYLEACTDQSETKTCADKNEKTSGNFSVENLFTMLRSHYWVPLENTVEHMKDYFERQANENWKGRKGLIINSRGYVRNPELMDEMGYKCSVCGEELGKDDCTAEETKYLKEYIHEEHLIGKDQYRYCDPKELDQTLRIVREFGPFDVIIDTANIYYSIGRGFDNAAKRHILKEVVDMFCEKYGCRVLLIAKEHLLRVSLPKLKKNAKLLQIGNRSADDVYYIYAALLSGPNTYIFSNDRFTNHCNAFLNGRVREIFLKWQRTRQILSKWNYKKRQHEIIWPRGTDIYPKMMQNKIHLPYFVDSPSRDFFEMPQHILCLSRRQEVQGSHH